MVAELLKHLNIKHVAMASHSCGTMYLFNMILVHRYLLHPKHPFVVFLGINSLPIYPLIVYQLVKLTGSTLHSPMGTS